MCGRCKTEKTWLQLNINILSFGDMMMEFSGSPRNCCTNDKEEVTQRGTATIHKRCKTNHSNAKSAAMV